jgi:hypothetical protein
MDKETFLETYKQEEDQVYLTNIIHDTFADFCDDNNIDNTDMSQQELRELAEEFVEKGLETN